MKTLEIIAGSNSADVIMADTSPDLLLGLRGVVAAGINTAFSDLQWLLYYGPMERMLVESDPFFQALVDRLPARPSKVENDETTRPNVISGKQDSLKRMAAIDGVGGGFFRVADIVQRRYVVSPAQEAFAPRPELNLGYAVSFSGDAMVDAMTELGVRPEIIDYRAEPDFPAFRERTIAQFFIAQTQLA